MPSAMADALAVGDWIEVQWPCQAVGADGGSVAFLWFKALVVELRQAPKRTFLLRFEDAEETWNSLKKVQWRRLENMDKISDRVDRALEVIDETVEDATGFVYCFEIEDEFLLFCDTLHERREELGDKSRGDCAYGEALTGGLVSVLIRREALPEPDREVYNRACFFCLAALLLFSYLF